MSKSKKSLIECAEVAGQIVYEYKNWGSEHISDMYATYEAEGRKPPFTIDQLEEYAEKMQSLKDQGKSFGEAVELAVKS